MLTDIEKGAATGFTGSTVQFFNLVLNHTRQGTFGDPSRNSLLAVASSTNLPALSRHIGSRVDMSSLDSYSPPSRVPNWSLVPRVHDRQSTPECS